MTNSQAKPLEADAFAPLATWMAGSIALLALAAFGPRLWASQRADAAAIAVELMAAGQLLLAVILWPSWTKSLGSAVGVIATSPVWLLLAGQLAHRSNGHVLDVAWKLAIALFVLAAIHVLIPRRAVGHVWAALTAIVLGVPVLLFLNRTY